MTNKHHIYSLIKLLNLEVEVIKDNGSVFYRWDYGLNKLVKIS